MRLYAWRWHVFIANSIAGQILIISSLLIRPPEEKAAEESTNDATSTEEATQKKKEKTRGGKNAKEGDNGDDQLSNASNNWSQKQQKALEAALAQFPKGSLERWERIAKLVPEKTKVVAPTQSHFFFKLKGYVHFFKDDQFCFRRSACCGLSI